MASPVDIKTEECLYTIAPESLAEWNPPANSPAPTTAVPQAFFPSYTEVPVSKAVRGPLKVEEQPYTFQRYNSYMPSSTSGRDYAGSHSPYTPSQTHVLSPIPSEQSMPAKRIPRPPNAFMLFRSDFLKKGLIPKDVEKRQQNLSRIIGEVWTMMEDEERQKWHQRAHEVQKQHLAQNPEYKFVPAPRGMRRTKDKVQTDEDCAAKAVEQTQRLRETYTRYLGPSPSSARKRRPKKARSVEAPSPVAQISVPQVAFPASTPPSAPSTNPFQIPPSTSICPQDPFFSPPYVPRRPSTSLGFVEHAKQDFPSSHGLLVGDMATRSAELSSDFLDFVHARGQNITPADIRPGAEASIPVPMGFDTSQWGPYSMTRISPQMEAKIQSPIHPQLAGPFSAPSMPSDSRHLEAFTPTGQFNVASEIDIPTLEAPSESTSPQLGNDDDDDAAFFASFGFSTEMLSFLQTPVDNPALANHDQEWQAGPSADFAKWEFENLYSAQQTGSQFTLTTGDFDSPL
ncbi:hypothetical protein GALMADRAFT_133211 [Galerina marginata CBS 339.88]|uniref:HMG box domain-containing protein n=1 Tax=Galerina marginata (strain CBS 339.88) TaxID=685588 RepID=A0A067TKV5_GALM3|nr:hypothetical protein GALMADRAFT_133211 [Galerina marginata CBS 339.88]